ncbi:MAG: PilZ domain-containing protein [Desulfuromusa sp.]|nr:PilZ domain-containing protein [Desulfuromusa sp.]
MLKRFFRYRKLLDEVVGERNSLVGNAAASEVSKGSIEPFMAILQGLLTGARGNFRYEFSVPLSVWICYSNNECYGNGFNLSTEGAGIEIPQTNSLPRVDGVTQAEFSLPDDEEKFSINGEIRWTQKSDRRLRSHIVITIPVTVVVTGIVVFNNQFQRVVHSPGQLHGRVSHRKPYRNYRSDPPLFAW